MQGMRAERLNGKMAHMLPWLGRAAVGLARAKGKVETIGMVREELAQRKTTGMSLPRAVAAGMVRTEFGHSFVTMVHLGIASRTKKSAVASVLARP
jgi:hypothetical protein